MAEKRYQINHLSQKLLLMLLCVWINRCTFDYGYLWIELGLSVYSDLTLEGLESEQRRWTSR